MSKKENFEKLTPGGGHEVAEPAVAYGTQSGALNGELLASGDDTVEQFKVDEYGRILLTDRMKEALQNAERSFAEGSCLNKEQFCERFAKWL